MSGVSFWELLLIFVIGLIVLGPERLPRVANQLGTWVGQARRMTRVLRRQLEDELNFEKETIRPRTPTTTANKTPVKALPHVPANEHDNTWSPAHDAGSPGTGISPPERNVDNDFADTDVLDEAVKGTKTSDEVVSPDRNSAANINT